MQNTIVVAGDWVGCLGKNMKKEGTGKNMKKGEGKKGKNCIEKVKRGKMPYNCIFMGSDFSPPAASMYV